MLSWIKSLIGGSGQKEDTSNASKSKNNRDKSLPDIILAKTSKKARSSAEGKPPTDYVLEAKRLFVELGLAMIPARKSRNSESDSLERASGAADNDSFFSSNAYRNLNLLYQYPGGKGCIYVGNDRAASSLETISKYKITSIVNCTRPARSGCLPNYLANTNRVRYYEFPVALWCEYVMFNPDRDGSKCANAREKFDQLTKFLSPFFQFIEKALKRGEGVLIHCLAGAHRAGTASILCLMHFSDLGAKEATELAKSIRPVIDPISDFPELLDMFERYRRTARQLEISDPIAPPAFRASANSGSSSGSGVGVGSGGGINSGSKSNLARSSSTPSPSPSSIADTLRAQASDLKNASVDYSARLDARRNSLVRAQSLQSAGAGAGAGEGADTGVPKRQRVKATAAAATHAHSGINTSPLRLRDGLVPPLLLAQSDSNDVANGTKRLKESASFHVDRRGANDTEAVSASASASALQKRRNRAVTFSPDFPSLGGPSPLEKKYSFMSGNTAAAIGDANTANAGDGAAAAAAAAAAATNTQPVVARGSGSSFAASQRRKSVTGRLG